VLVLSCQLVPVDISGCSHPKNILTVHPNLLQSPLRASPTEYSTDFIGQVRYLPQNPISEMCEVVYAPHLDMLRKDGEIVVSKGKRKQTNMVAAQQVRTYIHTYIQYKYRVFIKLSKTEIFLAWFRYALYLSS
jgi:hypothetical protein